MSPGSSVSGILIAHPDARYFGVGQIGRDQLEDYASRKGWTLERARRWLAPIIEGEASADASAATSADATGAS
jgi:5-methyltetrahydrofolate--homocysteine methyltransferase